MLQFTKIQSLNLLETAFQVQALHTLTYSIVCNEQTLEQLSALPDLQQLVRPLGMDEIILLTYSILEDAD